MAVVKGDAYGHGAIASARVAVESGAAWLGVVTLEEALELRRAGFTEPILILGPASPAQARTIVENNITTAVFEAEVAEALAAAGRRAGRPARGHLVVDTGMGRVGVTPNQDGVARALRLASLEGLVIDGVYTHYSTADEADKTFSRRQTALFDQFLDLAARAGLAFAWRHAAASAALINLPEARYNLVRPGISLYGLFPSADVDHSRVDLRPVMSWKSRVMYVKRVPAGTPISYGRVHITDRPTLVGTVPVGYADGYQRRLTGQAAVLVRGRRCPVLGRVNMDHIMIDLEAAGEARPGDEVVLMGRQEDSRTGAADCVPAEELAGLCGTIVNETVSMVGRRVPRVFIRGGRPVAARSILGEAGEEELGGG